MASIQDQDCAVRDQDCRDQDCRDQDCRDQDCATRASGYARLAEEPGNFEFREQYLHLAQAWMDLALEQDVPERHQPLNAPA